MATQANWTTDVPTFNHFASFEIEDAASAKALRQGHDV
jgi:hypothetical protein